MSAHLKRVLEAVQSFKSETEEGFRAYEEYLAKHGVAQRKYKELESKYLFLKKKHVKLLTEHDQRSQPIRPHDQLPPAPSNEPEVEKGNNEAQLLTGAHDRLEDCSFKIETFLTASPDIVLNDDKEQQQPAGDLRRTGQSIPDPCICVSSCGIGLLCQPVDQYLEVLDEMVEKANSPVDEKPVVLDEMVEEANSSSVLVQGKRMLDLQTCDAEGKKKSRSAERWP